MTKNIRQFSNSILEIVLKKFEVYIILRGCSLQKWKFNFEYLNNFWNSANN